MDGYTYRVPQIEKYGLFQRYPDSDTYAPSPYDYTYHCVFTELVVPNGLWVMERPSFGRTWLVGAQSDDIRLEAIDKRPRQERYLHVSNTPFGYIQAEHSEWSAEVRGHIPTSSRRLYCARQIHKGELGRGTPVPQIKFAREHPSLARKMQSFERNRHQKRNPNCWARLGDVVTASGASAHTLMATYWPFVGWSYDASRDSGAELLHVRFGDTHQEISDQLCAHAFLTREELGARIMDGQDLGSIWIRSGLANAMLRLQAFNYNPATTFTA